MRIENNKVFISGATSGIGLAIARRLHALGNQILVNGRDEKKLNETVNELKGSIAIKADLSLEEERLRVAELLKNEHPDLNWIINNAGLAYTHSLQNGANAFELAKNEINLNYLSIIHFTELLLPQLLGLENSAIVNVTSIAAFRGHASIPTYSASKAALQNYTNVLRDSLAEQENVRVFELIPPLVNTPFSKEIGGQEHGIPPEEVADELLTALSLDQYQVPVGMTKQFFQS
ncbi:SDR family oxidoreductase [Pedobacter chitinilyticus]|uniref:SDR family NAD(P)-dependent oxidoreductase n=1 Tax=Pedobacter chitinilyticus TaxID=2233776 RepID=A0A443Z188_9SPHI|nr:SDR family NAD(P)-dependent oxidoreductase [Pedobacter chitinilyticus]RWU10274.1 SDR family NAD(P)-dependent oxidoreductase [Pedobacter chitinilyticus]